MSQDTVERVDVKPGQRVKVTANSGSNEIRWWDVRAADDRFVILTRQRDFAPKGQLLYCIIDWERGVRGPCDLVLGPPRDLADDDAVTDMMAALNRHAVGDHTGFSTEVSHRNNVPAKIVAVR